MRKASTQPLDVEIEFYDLPSKDHFLLDRGANPNLMKCNPLLASIYQRHPKVARVLLDHGADPNVSEEGTPLFAAKTTGQDDIVRLLIEHGAQE